MVADIKNFWETVNPFYAHLKDGKKDQYFSGYRDLIINYLEPFELRGKKIIDYGCGGGFLGLLLFNEYQIKSYIGLDISERSLETAKERLKNFNCEFYESNITLKKFKTDYIFSFAVFQHIPEEKIMIDILKRFNESGVKKICLHYRYGKEIKFENQYEKNGNVGLCSFINSKFVSMFLSNYILKNESVINPISFAQGAIWILKN